MQIRSPKLVHLVRLCAEKNMSYGELRRKVQLSPAGLTAGLRRLADVYQLIEKTNGKWTATAEGRRFIEEADIIHNVSLTKDQREKLAKKLLFWQKAVSARDIPSFEVFRSLARLPWNQHRVEAYAVVDATEVRCDRELSEEEVVRLYVGLLKALKGFITPHDSRLILLVTFDLPRGFELAFARLNEEAAKTGKEKLRRLLAEAEKERSRMFEDAVRRYLK